MVTEVPMRESAVPGPAVVNGETEREAPGQGQQHRAFQAGRMGQVLSPHPQLVGFGG